MSAKQGFVLVVGLILLSLIEGIIKAFCPGFALGEVLAFQGTIAATILGTKVINDVAEMRNGLGVPKKPDGQ